MRRGLLGALLVGSTTSLAYAVWLLALGSHGWALYWLVAAGIGLKVVSDGTSRGALG